MEHTEHRIGAFEAKTHFARVLDRVEQGETITITRHGRPIARIVPEDQHNGDRARAAVERLKSLRGSVKGVGVDDLIEAIHAEHRY